MPRRSIFGEAKIRKVESRSKRRLDYAETQYLRRSQRSCKARAIFRAAACGACPATAGRLQASAGGRRRPARLQEPPKNDRGAFLRTNKNCAPAEFRPVFAEPPRPLRPPVRSTTQRPFALHLLPGDKKLQPHRQTKNRPLRGAAGRNTFRRNNVRTTVFRSPYA